MGAKGFVLVGKVIHHGLATCGHKLTVCFGAVKLTLVVMVVHMMEQGLRIGQFDITRGTGESSLTVSGVFVVCQFSPGRSGKLIRIGYVKSFNLLGFKRIAAATNHTAKFANAMLDHHVIVEQLFR